MLRRQVENAPLSEWSHYKIHKSKVENLIYKEININRHGSGPASMRRTSSETNVTSHPVQ